MIEKQTGKQVKRLRTDNGLEFCSNEFNALFRATRIVRHNTVHHNPQQISVVERMNQTLMEKVCCMRLNASLPKSLWAEIAAYACHLINRSPSIAIDKKTPQEVWFGSPSSYSDLKIIGCPMYAHVDNGNLEPRSVKCVFIDSVDVASSSSQAPQPYSIARDRPRRENIKAAQGFAKSNLVAYTLKVSEEIDSSEEPATYSKAVSSDSFDKWMITMQEKNGTLHKNSTWDLVKIPKDKKTVKCKWVFKLKEGTPGVEDTRYKARLVAKIYSQISSVDFTDVLPCCEAQFASFFTWYRAKSPSTIPSNHKYCSSKSLPGQASRPTPGQVPRCLLGQASRSFPGQASRSLPGQASRPQPGIQNVSRSGLQVRSWSDLQINFWSGLQIESWSDLQINSGSGSGQAFRSILGQVSRSSADDNLPAPDIIALACNNRATSSFFFFLLFLFASSPCWKPVAAASSGRWTTACNETEGGGRRCSSVEEDLEEFQFDTEINRRLLAGSGSSDVAHATLDANKAACSSKNGQQYNCAAPSLARPLPGRPCLPIYGCRTPN
ncbi:hypothetical protein ZIOFF_014531 [Zingiber officinale]|uniref:Integrase catalytic domain-containing protein n=1 Tax=Zingiber officinale TaxID=94328 RepID=A0A8J5LLQ4_ZINOF|nr:hypothetical protein ZIOFF_014531 [Zingiber officinale]